MTYDEYIDQRVNHQIDWYDKKSVTNKRWFIFLKIAEILLALCIPFISNFLQNSQGFSYVVSFIGVCIAAIAGLLALLKLQENWIEYRTVAEALKHEKFLFLTSSGIYNTEDRFERFVERFESQISKETSNWAQYIRYENLQEKTS